MLLFAAVAIVIAFVVVVFVPAMVMTELAVVPIPISRVVLLPIVTRLYPPCTFICRPAPVAVVPLIVVAYGVPVTAHPEIGGARASGLHSHHAYRWRRADPDSDGKLREDRPRCQ